MPNIAVSNPAGKAAQHPLISTTGVRGFLQWMKTDPLMSKVYQQIQPQLDQMMGNQVVAGAITPSVNVATNAPMTFSGTMNRRRGYIGRLGQCCYDFCYVDSGPSGLETNVSTSSISSSIADVCDSTIALAPTDAAQSSSLVNSISGLISTGASVALTAAEISNANAVTTAQLQQAAAGKPPLNLSASAFGGMVTGTGTILGISDTVWLIGGALVLFLLMRKKHG